jgi:methionyl-tRNA synthetase
MEKFFITTPIYYINDVPHIGHTCTTLAADILARLHRQLGEEVFFLTGTDEHGEKVAEVAAEAGISPQEFCDKIAPRFEEAWKNLNISYDFFIRTTDPRHEKIVGEMLQKIYDAGDVYKDKYEGWYCTGCEAFKTDKELVNGHCPLHPPEKTVRKSEENWFFKLSKYVPAIIKLIENDKTNYIFPESKRSEILAKLKAGVNNISITREKVKWGIPAPWDKNHTIYVWIDALINYYSATRFVNGKAKFWPADLHILGKEILWFHTVIWQAMLLSAKIDLPKKTYTHSFYMIDGQKMSKSLGNVISPDQLIKAFGIDGARYLVATSFPSENDSDVGMARFKEKYNADLANNLGNLVSRVCKLGEGIQIPLGSAASPFDKGDFIKLVDNLKLDEAVSLVFDKYIDKSNSRLNEVTPWKLDVNDQKRIEVLTECAANLKLAALHLKSVMPETAEKIEKLFDGKIKALDKPLFPRLV